MSGATEPYVVEIKRSARRVNGAASEWVARRGRTRTFATKADARRWAVAISGDGPVRVQDAAPNDPDDVDGYLVVDPLYRRRSRDPEAGGTNSTFAGLDSEATENGTDSASTADSERDSTDGSDSTSGADPASDPDSTDDSNPASDSSSGSSDPG